MWYTLTLLLASAAVLARGQVLCPPLAPTRYVDEDGDRALTYDDWLSLEDVDAFLDNMEALYPYVSTETIGFSYEGKRMKVLKVR